MTKPGREPLNLSVIRGKRPGMISLHFYPIIRRGADILAPILLIAVVWELYARVSHVPDYILPTPPQILVSMVRQYKVLAVHSFVTFQESLAGLIVGAAVGIATATLLYFSMRLATSVMPMLIMFNSFPKIAIAPLLILWLGTGMLSKIALSALLVFFPIAVNVLAGLTRVEAELLELFRSFHATRWTTLRRIRFPNAFPYFVDGLKIAIPLAVIGAIVGEFVGASSGLGYLLLVAASVLDGPLQFAVLIMMGVISLPFFYLMVGWPTRVFARRRWQEPDVDRSQTSRDS